MDIKVTDFYTEGRLGIERIAELYNVLYGVKSVGLRFFSVYGPHEEAKGIYANIVTQFLWEIKKGKSPVIYGDGSQKRDFVFVKDIVNALILASKLECGYDIFNVGTGKSYSFNNVVDILNNKLNTKIKPIYVKIPMKNYIDCTLSDTNKMKNIGYHTEYNLERGLDEYI
jgi:UDP-glucose 4-epimerase